MRKKDPAIKYLLILLCKTFNFTVPNLQVHIFLDLLVFLRRLMPIWEYWTIFQVGLVFIGNLSILI